MRKFKDFILAFGWLLGCETISMDLGLISNAQLWTKYLSPFVFGLLYAFLIWPNRAKQKIAKEAQQVRLE